MITKHKILYGGTFVILWIALLTIIFILSQEFGLKQIALNENIVNSPTIYAYKGMDWPSRYTVSPIFWLPLHLIPAQEYQELEQPTLLTLPYWIFISFITSILIFKLLRK